jgi:hypothetical protein
MTGPWQAHTRKGLDGITHSKHPRAGHGFVAPAAQSKLDFTRAELCASMAMTNALSGLSGPAAISLAHAMSQLVTDHVDDIPATPLRFLDSLNYLADSTRSYFSACIGTGIADRYALALGYRFRCNSRELIPSGRAGDFLYDGSPLPPNCAVMVEAKGSLQGNLSFSLFKQKVQQGYVGQVEPHVGKTYPTPIGHSLTIAHGYAVGCAAKVPRADAIAYVIETAHAGIGPPHGDSLSGSADVALGNYQGVATLLGDELLHQAIYEARGGDSSKGVARTRRRHQIRWRGHDFIVFDDSETTDRSRRRDSSKSRVPRLRFAIWLPAYEAILKNLADKSAIWRMPEVPRVLVDSELNDGGAVLPDGLALLPPWYDESASDQTSPRMPKPAFEPVLEAALNEKSG